MSKTTKTTVTLDNPGTIRKFFNGTCTREAMPILEEVGIFNLEAEEFDNAILAIDAELGTDAEMQAVIEELLHSDGAISEERAISLGRTLDIESVNCLMRRSKAAYLLGLAVGRQIGGAR